MSRSESLKPATERFRKPPCKHQNRLIPCCFRKKCQYTDPDHLSVQGGGIPESKFDGPKMDFYGLRNDIEDFVCDQARHLRTRLDQLIDKEQLQANDVFSTGAQIQNLSAICCLLTEMLSGKRSCALPTAMEIQNHATFSSVESDCCPCCSVDSLLDLDGDILMSFPDWNNMPVDEIVQKSALAAVVEEAEKVFDRMEKMKSGEEEIENQEDEEIAAMFTGKRNFQRIFRRVSSALQWLIKKPKCMWPSRRRPEQEPVESKESMPPIATAA